MKNDECEQKNEVGNMASHGHSRQVCVCGKIIATCRCIEGARNVTIVEPCVHGVNILRKVIGDSPEHAKHIIMDSKSTVPIECNGGLAFAIGVAVQECMLAKEEQRLFTVCHPNMVVIYCVAYSVSGVAVVVSRVAP